MYPIFSYSYSVLPGTHLYSAPTPNIGVPDLLHILALCTSFWRTAKKSLEKLFKYMSMLTTKEQML